MTSRMTPLDLQIEAAEAAVWAADRDLVENTHELKVHARRWSSYARPALMVATVVALRRVPGWILGSLGQAPDLLGKAGRAGRGALLLRALIPVAGRWIAQRMRTAGDRAESAASGHGSAAPSAQTSRPAPHVAAALDRARFAGQWFVQFRLPEADAAHPGARLDYTVVDGGFEVTETSHAADGSEAVSSGKARQRAPEAHPAELEITFASGWARWLPGSWTDHWVLLVDRDYRFAMIGDRARARLMVLSRDAHLDPAILAGLLETARLDGYPAEHVAHAPPAGDRVMDSSAAPSGGH